MVSVQEMSSEAMIVSIDTGVQVMAPQAFLTINSQQ